MTKIWTVICGCVTILGLPAILQANGFKPFEDWKWQLSIAICLAYISCMFFWEFYNLSKKQSQNIASIMSLIIRFLNAGRSAFFDLQKKSPVDGLNEIERIVLKHSDTIKISVDEQILYLKNNINSKINDEFLKKLKNEKNKKFLFQEVCKELIDLEKIQMLLERELKQAQNEIKAALAFNLFGNGKYEIYLKWQANIEQKTNDLASDNGKIIQKIVRKIFLLVHPELKEIFSPDYYNKVMIAAFGVPNITDIVSVDVDYEFSEMHIDFDISGWDMFAIASIFDIGGINELITGSIQDILVDELHINIGMEIAEFIGLSLIDLSGISLILKGARLIRLGIKAWNAKPIDINDLRSKVIRDISNNATQVLNKSTEKLVVGWNEFLNLMVERILKLRAKHNKILKITKKYSKRSNINDAFFFKDENGQKEYHYYY